MASRQSTNECLMVSPTAFMFNAEAALDNAFMFNAEAAGGEAAAGEDQYAAPTQATIRAAAVKEHAALCDVLTAAGVKVR